MAGAALIAGVCLLLGRRRLAALAVLGPGLAGVATTVLKPAIGRQLDVPAGLWFSFPSGHTAGAAAIAIAFSGAFDASVGAQRTQGVRGGAGGVPLVE